MKHYFYNRERAHEWAVYRVDLVGRTCVANFTTKSKARKHAESLHGGPLSNGR